MKKKTKFIVEPFDDIRIIGINTGMLDYMFRFIEQTDCSEYKEISDSQNQEVRDDG